MCFQDVGEHRLFVSQQLNLVSQEVSRDGDLQILLQTQMNIYMIYHLKNTEVQRSLTLLHQRESWTESPVFHLHEF